jgi:hypothetical protein
LLTCHEKGRFFKFNSKSTIATMRLVLPGPTKTLRKVLLKLDLKVVMPNATAATATRRFIGILVMEAMVGA